MTFGSLFSGIGGLDLGLERAGMTCRWQVEVDPFCRRVLAKHWPEVPKYGDIRDVTGAELERVDLIAGGFPCQDLSQAGKRAGIEGSRSGLWFEFARLIGALRPRFVLIENVPGLLVPGAMSRVVGELARLGYVGIWRCLRASEFGAAHIRKRVFIVARNMGDARSEYRGGDASTEAIEDCNRPHDGISGQAGSDAVGKLAHCPTGGWRELREPSGSCGLADGSGEDVADADNARRSECDSTKRRIPEPRTGNIQLADTSDGLLPQPRRGSQGRDGAGSTSAPLGNTECAPEDIRLAPSGPRYSTGESSRELEHADGSRSARALPEALPRRNATDDAGAPLPDSGGAELPDAEQAELRGPRRIDERRAVAELRGAPFPFAPGPADERWPAILADYPWLAPSQPCIRGVVDGLPGWLVEAMSDRTKRLGKLGNAVVPQVAEWIGRRIMEAAA